MKSGVHPQSTAFLLAQVGAHASGRFAQQLDALGLGPPHAGTLRLISISPGISQQALSSMLRLAPSRLVLLVDELEERGLVERRSSSEDRRVYALHVTEAGAAILADIAKLSREHDDATCAALSSHEREKLASLLRRIADQQGLEPGVHPGFSRLGRAPSKERKKDANRSPKRRQR